MYDTGGTHSVCRPAAVGDDIDARLRWLRTEIALAEGGALARREAEACAAMLMRDPLDAAEAYGWFGLFLGLFPPAAIFCRLFGPAAGAPNFGLWALLSAIMLAVCCLVGRKAGRSLAAKLGDPREYPWPLLLLVSLFFGLVWGFVTGGAGGLVFFGVGALAGIFCAVPVALAAFPLFALLHRQLSRGGMIEERLLWPLAFGIPGLIAATILGQ